MRLTKDEFGKTWDLCDNNPLDHYIKTHRLNLELSYETDKQDGLVYFILKITDSKNKSIVDIKQKYPLDDSEILGLIKQIIRSGKIDLLGI